MHALRPSLHVIGTVAVCLGRWRLPAMPIPCVVWIDSADWIAGSIIVRVWTWPAKATLAVISGLATFQAWLGVRWVSFEMEVFEE